MISTLIFLILALITFFILYAYLDFNKAIIYTPFITVCLNYALIKLGSLFGIDILKFFYKIILFRKFIPDEDYILSSDKKILVEWLNDKIKLLDMSKDRSLKKVITIGENGKSVFNRTSNLTNIKLTNNVIYIGEYAFNNAKIVSINLSNNLERIGENAFSNSSLQSIVIPDSVKTIEKRAFESCSLLKTINLSNNLLSIERNTFYECSSLQSITIPNKVKYVGEYSFKDCTSLQSVIISDNIKKIETGAFENCTSLQSVVIPNGITTIENNTFAGCSSLETINIPDNLISIDSNAFINCVTLDNIEMTNVRIIRRAAFYGCKSLHTIKLSKYLTSIEEDTFKYCSSLETIIIPPSVRDIGSCAFYKTGLTTITIPESVTRIDHETFSNCYKLVSITFESMIPPVIDSTIFKDTYLEAIYVPSESVEKYKTAKNWGNYASIIQAIKNRTIESTEDKIMKESDNSIYLNQKQGIQKIRNLVQKRLGKNLTDFMEEDGILWWRVKGKETGMWLRVGDTNNSGKTYITYWSDFYNNRQYTSYRYAQRGESKDWIQGYKLIDAFDYNLLRKSEELSQESIEALADEIIKFYEEGLVNGKTISEIIEECNQ